MSPGATAATVVAFRMQAPATAEDAVVTALWESGTSGVHVQPGPAGAILLVAYFPDRAGLRDELRTSLAAIGVDEVEPAPIPDVDWVARFREGFRAFDVGGFHVVPAWDAAPVSRKAGRTLRVLPARAFGTGTHESTRLCLSALESLAARRSLGRVVDVGAGTGILAVAAALLGARSVTAIDIDPEAVESAREHARMNGVALHLVRGDGGRPFAPGRFDLVLANITAPLLLERRDEIAVLGAPSASVVLAGFLREDAGGIAEAYAGLGPGTTQVDGEWAALLIERR
jgi:ribosomal protein L11 methyltransferase